MHPPYRGLAFLLSMGTLPIACNDGGEESDTKSSDPTGGSGSGSDSDSGTTGGTTNQVTTATPTTGGSDSATGTSTGGPDTNGSQGFITTATTGASATEGDTDTLPPVTDPTCLAYGAHIVECFPRYESYRQYIGYYCEYYKAYGLRVDGRACADAFDGMYVCFSELPCEDFMNEDMPACEKEVAIVNQDCPSLAMTDTTGGDTTGDSGGSSTGGSSTGGSSSTGP